MKLDVDSLVSMNMWGFTPEFLKTLEEGFKEFFEKEVPANPLKAEYLIPTFIGELLSEGKMSVKVLRTNDTSPSRLTTSTFSLLMMTKKNADILHVPPYPLRHIFLFFHMGIR